MVRFKFIVKRYAERLGVNIEGLRFLKKHILGTEHCANIYGTKYKKNCLIRYITYPFLKKMDVERHQHEWQVCCMAHIISMYGFNIDVIDFQDTMKKLSNNYDLILDIVPHKNDVYKKICNSNCIKIAYLTGMNPRVANYNENIRLKNLVERRNIKISKERQAEPLDKSVEAYDAFFYIGNEYNIGSYNEFILPPIYYIKNTGYNFKKVKFTDKRSNVFVFFASSGQVHKGLDLLLDIFSQDNFPCELYICSCVYDEREFYEAYYYELTKIKNIHTLGFVDIDGVDFWNVMDKCAYAVMPSCSEGMAGSILTCMSAGVIPIVSRECGFDDDVVINLPNCEIETIEEYILSYSEKDIDWIIMKAKETVEIVKNKYSKKNYISIFSSALEDVLQK